MYWFIFYYFTKITYMEHKKKKMIIETKYFDISINNIVVTINRTALQFNNVYSPNKVNNFELDSFQDILFDKTLINNALYNCLIKLINILANIDSKQCDSDKKQSKCDDNTVYNTSYYTLFDTNKQLINNTYTSFTFKDIKQIDTLINIIERCDNAISNETDDTALTTYYEMLYSELCHIITTQSGTQLVDFTLYKFGNVSLLNYYDMRTESNWNMLIYLITECLNSPNVDKVFKPRPEYIDEFKNFSTAFTTTSLVDCIQYFDLMVKHFITTDNKERFGAIDKEQHNLFTNLEYYIYQYNPVVYDIIITALNNFNMYNLTMVNNSELGISKSSSNITIYKVESNDIELEKHFNTTIRKLPDDVNTYAYHGSYITNWYSILFNGLYTPSASDYLMANANAHGKGVYLSNSFNFSLGYCRSSKYKIVGVFQTINDLKKYKKTINIYVVPDSKDLILRYLIYFNSASTSASNAFDNYFIDKKNYIQPSTSVITKRANRRVINELRNLQKRSGVRGNNYDIYYHFNIPDDANMNIFIMSVDISNFDNESALYANLCAYDITSVDFEFRLPEEYPFKPPFIRIISPRFKYMTGHITLGGSICMEILTNQLWVPSLMLNKVILMIVQNMIIGGAELDPKSYKKPYTYEEAIAAYKRMLVSHSDWK